MRFEQKPTIRHTTPPVDHAARELRAHATPAEEVLWQALRGRQLGGLKFRRQHPVDRFILDFYCPSHRLVIEIDGSSHNEKQDYDQARTERLEAYRYCVLRFSNREVLGGLDAVLVQILAKANEIAGGS